MPRFACLAFALAIAASSASRGADDVNDTIEGTWLPTAAEIGGREFPEEVRKSIRLEVKGDQYTATVGTQPDRGTCELDPKSRPRALDITGTEGPNKGKTIPAIYERVGDTLRICYNLGGNDRPKEFATRAGTRLFLVTYKREKP